MMMMMMMMMVMVVVGIAINIVRFPQVTLFFSSWERSKIDFGDRKSRSCPHVSHPTV